MSNAKGSGSARCAVRFLVTTFGTAVLIVALSSPVYARQSLRKGICVGCGKENDKITSTTCPRCQAKRQAENANRERQREQARQQGQQQAPDAMNMQREQEREAAQERVNAARAAQNAAAQEEARRRAEEDVQRMKEEVAEQRRQAEVRRRQERKAEKDKYRERAWNTIAQLSQQGQERSAIEAEEREQQQQSYLKLLAEKLGQDSYATIKTLHDTRRSIEMAEKAMPRIFNWENRRMFQPIYVSEQERIAVNSVENSQLPTIGTTSERLIKERIGGTVSELLNAYKSSPKSGKSNAGAMNPKSPGAFREFFSPSSDAGSRQSSSGGPLDLWPPIDSRDMGKFDR